MCWQIEKATTRAFRRERKLQHKLSREKKIKTKTFSFEKTRFQLLFILLNPPAHTFVHPRRFPRQTFTIRVAEMSPLELMIINILETINRRGGFRVFFHAPGEKLASRWCGREKGRLDSPSIGIHFNIITCRTAIIPYPPNKTIALNVEIFCGPKSTLNRIIFMMIHR